MKKLKVLALVVSLVTVINFSAEAQTKLAYIDQEAIVYLMPDAKVADSLLRQFEIDSVGPQYQNIFELYQFQDSTARDSTKPKSVRDEAANKAAEYRYTLQNWQEIAGQVVQAKQQQLYAPIMQKIRTAINAVAKEKSYAYVISADAVVVAPEADNILVPVLTKLKIPIPPQLQPGAKPAGNGTGRP
ncbi:MAG TPA: OmpH family outer membrane protein [Chitinophagaceae bacterium]|nr:OmpH family outer membrane protein [Chitinophagaceae bacterium]